MTKLFLNSFAIALLVGTAALGPSYGEDETPTETRLKQSTPVQTASILPRQQTVSPWTVPAAQHLWARHAIGSWREIEITTETFAENGQLVGQSITTQKEILKAVTEDSYVLDVQATVDISGKRIEGPWSTRVLRLATDKAGTIASAKRLEDHLLALPVGSVSCQVWEVAYNDEGQTHADVIYYSPQIYPHVLARNTTAQSPNLAIDSPPLDALTTMARTVPYLHEGRIFDCAVQQTISRRGKGDSQKVATLSAEIPGGELKVDATDFDSAGRRIRWSIQKLIAYESQPARPNSSPDDQSAGTR